MEARIDQFSAQDEHAVAVVLLKCARGRERDVESWFANLQAGVHCAGTCLFTGAVSDEAGNVENVSDGPDKEEAALAAEAVRAQKRRKGAPGVCCDVRVCDTAYSFGPFDFFVTIKATDIGLIEEFVVSCLRASTAIVLDTQTLVGIPIQRHPPQASL